MSNDQTLKEAIEAWIGQLRNRNQFYEGKVVSLWDSIVGPIIAKETDHLYVKNKVLFVRLRSQALRHELEFAKKKLVKNINNAAGKDIINDIAFI